MQLFTQQNFTIVRQIPDHTDATTYYVQAVIRNARTDVTLATLNLTNKGSQRFKSDWKVPADPSGEGFYVSVITSVYTDSGYTTKASSYGDDENTYLITDRKKSGAGGVNLNVGQGSLSIRDIRDVIKEEIQKAKPEPVKKEVQKEVDLSEILKAIKVVENKIEPVSIPKVDLEPIKASLVSLKRSIEAIEIPEVDLEPLMSKMGDVGDNNDVSASEMRDLLKEASVMIINQIGDKIEKILAKTTIKVNPTGVELKMEGKLNIEDKVEPVVEEVAQPMDISNLSK